MMFAYFDVITISLMGLREDERSWLSWARLLSAIAVAILIILPIVVFTALLTKFDFFLNKSSKKTLGALLEKIDKGTKFRVL
jgi:hypothetical protein